MTSVLFLVVRIYRNHSKRNYLTNTVFFLNFLLHFYNFHQTLIILKIKATLIAYVFRKLETAKDVVS